MTQCTCVITLVMSQKKGKSDLEKNGKRDLQKNIGVLSLTTNVKINADIFTSLPTLGNVDNIRGVVK